MCAAHTCMRSALTHAFHAPKCRIPVALSIPEFLVPAVARPPTRSFSAIRHQSADAQQTPPSSLEPPTETISLLYPPKPAKEPLPFRIALPDPDVRRDIQPWLAALDPFLPSHLRQRPLEEQSAAHNAEPLDFSWLLVEAQSSSHDILGYIGLIERRWDTVVWIVKKLVEGGAQVLEPPAQFDPFANVIWPEAEPRSLQDLTNEPMLTYRALPSKRLRHSLDDLTSAPESINLGPTVVKRALGQVWRSLGTMILAAVQERNQGESQIMSRVLEIIAYLHHAGLVPDSVYTYHRPQDRYALQQPPTLHLLSSQILTALSDATWRAHEASVKVAKERMNASYFLGHEIPGSRYRVHVTEIVPELWLELVLWSCLHGGWVLDGTAILERMLPRGTESPWGLISWSELLENEEDTTTSTTTSWRLFGRRKKEQTKFQDEARARTQRTISSEIVTAFIDGLVNTMRLGVGARGTLPEDLVEHIKNLKQLLDHSSLSLGSATWESIMVRLLESGGMVPEKRPELLLSIVGLASGFGSEIGSANASQTSKAKTEPPYFFEPSTTSIRLLHRTMQSFVQNGDVSGAMTTLNTLQHYTDENKQRSLQRFFEALKEGQPRQAQPSTSTIPPIDFPAFDTQLPTVLLARLLDLITDAKVFDLGRWLLLSQELDGPLITRDMYGHLSMAASIIRFGTLAGENDLVMKIVKKTGLWNSREQVHRLPDKLFTALLNSQVQLHRWEAVSSMQNYVMENPGYRPRPEVLANYAAELLRLSNEATGNNEPQASKARTGLTELLFAWEALILTRLGTELYCVLGILSSISTEWKVFCSKFLAFSTRQPMRLSTDDFNQILGGVLDGMGSLKGREVVDMWCYRPPKTFEPYRAPGGLPTMPQFRAGKSEEYESKPEDHEIVQPSGAKLILQGRVHPNRQTVWAVLRKVQQEEDQRRARGEQLTVAKREEVRGTLKWAARLLYYLGFDYEDIIRDLGSLAELAELERPPMPMLGVLAEEQGPEA